MKFKPNPSTNFPHTLNVLLHYLWKVRKLKRIKKVKNLFKNYKCNNLKTCHIPQERKYHV